MKLSKLILVSIVCGSIVLTSACSFMVEDRQINSKEPLMVASEQIVKPNLKLQLKENKKQEVTLIKIEQREVDGINSESLPAGKLHKLKKPQSFPEVYTEVEGVLTFRGNNLRNAPSFGTVKTNPAVLEKVWSFTTGASPRWGGGAGWTGQPAIVKWTPEVREMMNLKEEFRTKENFTEVIYASLDGKIYFFDLESGVQSRNPINIGNPIKGSVSIDPRGYPLLYTGQGIPQQGKIGFRIFSLIDGKLLHFIPGLESSAYRNWGAFDGSALVNRETDTLVMGGENGLFYTIKLNTDFDIEKKSIKISPDQIKYRYKVKGNQHQGIENSVATYKNLAFFADNGGSIQAVDLMSMKPVWALPASDDTDATIVIDAEESVPYLYTGTEVDKLRGSNSHSLIRKINGLTGDVVWKKDYQAFFYDGVNGGLLATPVMGKNEIEDLVIFTIARHKTMNGGIMVALNKSTGEEVWRWQMPNYAWSSPVAVYDEDGKAYLIQCDSSGTMHLLNGKTGEVITKINLGANIEASPAIYHDSIVVATRGGKMIHVKIK